MAPTNHSDKNTPHFPYVLRVHGLSSPTKRSEDSLASIIPNNCAKTYCVSHPFLGLTLSSTYKKSSRSHFRQLLRENVFKIYWFSLMFSVQAPRAVRRHFSGVVFVRRNEALYGTLHAFPTIKLTLLSSSVRRAPLA